ncbi:MAG: relaxase/mobilization nuclease domain-containing protein [Prevotella sp.]|jgi:relaxase/mobilization nuclease domain protein|uniref:relaxase/mobilization nuclease domain-containing protein n=1 Tax=Prevotella sp. TaxID=59823 RepID=UPI001CB48B89|nr:relaxase/mobilization nuclease domain-containing protein [Prevotella sp.]MBF1583257.1 relaxase/mobilization nuclease domain-containing protein [Prevotella sp.]MBF1599221.1 relaxase/mobilization nuclease domain-containing protein [Prevotella sp.]
MIAKIIKGADFGGVINYMLSKQEGKAMVLASNNIGFTDQNLCVHEFVLQASMRPNVQKPVCHTILSFSANDADQLTDDVMIKIANEYLEKMGYGDTQSLIVRHSDRQHPHLHICINRIGNDGKTISDRNEKYRSTKICRELTERYGLTLGEGKKAVNRHRLRGEDKLRYEIFDAIKTALLHSKNWKDFVADLERQDIATRFKTKGNTDVVQGIIFKKNGCSFSGSKIDRSCSFSRLNAEIERNSHKQEQIHLQNEPMVHSVDESNFITDLSEAISEVFSIPTPSNGVDVDELRFQKKLRNKANRKRRI